MSAAPIYPPRHCGDDEIAKTLGSLRRALRAYALLELRVTILLARRFGPRCAPCRGHCCDAAVCRESMESDWLRLLSASSGRTGGPFDPAAGWQSPAGCRLSIGRPPICYEFFCNAALDAQPGGRYRERLMAAAALVPQVGERAMGRRHLVTLTAGQIFGGRLDTRRLCLRITGALSRLTAISAFLGSAAPESLTAARPQVSEAPILLVDVVS